LKTDLEHRVTERTQELSQVNQKLRDASQAKSQFLANMSHELRTPLNAIIGYSEMLTEVCVDNQMNDLLIDLEKIRFAGKHLLRLINDILDLSKIEAGKMELHLESIQLRSMIQDVISTVRPMVEKNSNTLDVHVDNAPMEIQSDVTRLQQILLNL